MVTGLLAGYRSLKAVDRKHRNVAQPTTVRVKVERAFNLVSKEFILRSY